MWPLEVEKFVHLCFKCSETKEEHPAVSEVPLDACGMVPTRP